MLRNSLFFKAAVLGLGLAVSDQLAAQSSTSGTSGAQTSGSTSGTSGSTGGVVNLRDEPSSARPASGGAGLVQLRDLLNYRIQAQDGSFGRVSDVVFDRNGNIQYLLGTYQGQTFPLPYMASAFAGTGNTLTYNVPVSALQQLAINPQTLPSLQNQAFTQRMQQVFGSSLGNSFSAYPPGMNAQTGTGATGAASGNIGRTPGTGATSSAGTTSGTRTTSTAGTPAGTSTAGASTGGSIAGSTIGASSIGTPGRAGMNNDNWNWPANPAGIVPGTGNNRFANEPGTPRGAGTATGNNAGIRSNTGTMNNSGAGGTSGTRGSTSGAGTSGTTSGSGTSGNTSGSGTSGTTKGAGTTGSGTGGTTGSGSGGTTGSGSSGSGS